MVLQASDEALIPADGLTSAQAAQRLREHGPNVLPGGQQRTLRTMVWETGQDPMFLLLLAAGCLYLLLGDWQEGLALLVFVLVVLGLTLYQEGRTERAVAALRDLSSPRALVLRDGKLQRIAGSEVVVGDIIALAEGDRIAADALLLSANNLLVDESLLTGEAVPVRKAAGSADSVSAPPGGDDQPFVYSGTMVNQGQGMARVRATGANSEIGRIGATLQTLQVEKSPLKKLTAQLVLRLAWIALLMSLALVLVTGWLRGDWTQAWLAGIALAMSMLPEEFTVVLTVLPALGALRLSRVQVLTRRIAAIETLGATSVLCVDKTGTLTLNRMTVAQLYADGQLWSVDYAVPDALPEDFHTLVEFSILASEADPFDAMEQAFHRLGLHFLADTEHLHRDWKLVHEYALTTQLRAMSHVWRAVDGEEHEVAAKGAPEAIMDLCHLDEASQRRIGEAVDAMAAQGLRVLGVARARFAGEDWPAIEHDFEFEFVGLLGLADPLRPEITQAVRECQQAGIRVVMITGDYPATARAIAQQAQLDATDVLGGDELDALSDDELRRRLQTVNVCARIAPQQKLRIVQALKADGAIVAMTGDGVNDAPALKAAHVGVAMGKRGTDVAREAASLVLLDDNFTSIVRAVRLGRRIYDNLRKSMSYILAVHVPIAGAALAPVLLGWPVLLYPIHIAFLELIIDPACSMVFEGEPPEDDAMQRPPRDPKAPLFAGRSLWLALLQGMGVLGVVLAATAWALTRMDESQLRAFAFTILVLGNLGLMFGNRKQRVALLGSLQTHNRALWAVCGMALVFLGMALYQPWLAHLFRFAALPAADLALAAALGFGAGLAMQWLKAWSTDAGQRPPPAANR
jgi:Ca2+-transporting ATPase